MLAAVAVDDEWGLRFFAGVAFDTAQTLPLIDPWRRTIVIDGVATRDGQRSGTTADHADLVPQVMPDLSIDVALVAVADDLDPAVAVVVARAFDSDDSAVAALRAASGGAPAGIVAAGTAAVQWLAFRRRCYVGMTDLWVYDSCWWRAEFEWKSLRGEIDDDETRTLSADRIGRERIADDAYLADDGGNEVGFGGG